MKLRELAGFAIMVAVLFPIVGAIDARPQDSPDVLETLPPEPLLPVLAFGHRESAADILELRVTNFLIGHLKRFSRLDADQLWDLYSAIMALDPENVGACHRGSTFLSSMADDPDRAVHMLDLSLGEVEEDVPRPPELTRMARVSSSHPMRWLLYHELASVHFLMYRQRAKGRKKKQHHTRRAGELWMFAGNQPTAPEWFVNVGRKLATRGVTRVQALRHEKALWEVRASSGDDLQRGKARERLNEALCGLNREAIQTFVDGLRAEGLPVPAKVEDLQIKRQYIEDPLGVGFIIRRGEKVVAPAYEAARTQRELAGAFGAWRLSNPDKVPTLEDFAQIELQPYLRLVVTAEGLEIHGVMPE